MEDLIIGPLPPPLGGISVYLYRLKKSNPGTCFLDESKMGKRDWLGLFLLRKRHFIYHSPSLRRRLYLFGLCLLTGNSFSLVVHGASLELPYAAGNRITRFVIRRMLHKAKAIHVVNPAIKRWLIHDVGLPEGKIDVFSSFLPPPEEDEAQILASYDPETKDFIASHFPLIVANAHSLSFHQGTDLYGLDFCIKLVAELKAAHSEGIGLVFALAQTGDGAYLSRMRDLCDTLGISENVHFLTGQKEVWPLFKSAQLMVRPTFMDGFGISVAEAIHLGCPAVASDVCRRAHGTILFENRNFPDFLAKCLSALAERRKRNESIDQACVG
jgi:glycosyltransferase involved in cell wall biosynthesis